MDRRHFLKGVGVSAMTLGFAPHLLFGQSRRPKVLVTVFQRGAADGLNMVIPFKEPRYRRLRPTIAVPDPSSLGGERSLDLDGFFGFHPEMAPLKPLFDAGRLGVVHAAGSPSPTRSHFDAQNFMESATPGATRTTSGWINRYVQSAATGEEVPFRGMSIGRSLPRSLAGRATTFSIGSVAEARLNGPERLYRELYAEGPDDLVSQAAREMFSSLTFLEVKRPGRYAPEVDYPQGRFPANLREVAKLIKADVGLEVVFVDIGGWDHHAGEGGVRGALANRLRDFSGGLRAFHDDLGDRIEDVVIVTMSEFGRTVKENGNGGTDHGHGNVMLALGGPVQGGQVYGRWPGLEREQLYEARDLAITTDFRTVLGEVVTKHLGARDLDVIFPGFDLGELLGFLGLGQE